MANEQPFSLTISVREFNTRLPGARQADAQKGKRKYGARVGGGAGLAHLSDQGSTPGEALQALGSRLDKALLQAELDRLSGGAHED